MEALLVFPVQIESNQSKPTYTVGAYSTCVYNVYTILLEELRVQFAFNPRPRFQKKNPLKRPGCACLLLQSMKMWSAETSTHLDNTIWAG